MKTLSWSIENKTFALLLGKGFENTKSYEALINGKHVIVESYPSSTLEATAKSEIKTRLTSKGITWDNEI